jgi:hypothetical protein
VIVTTQYRDLYYGEVAATDAEIVKTKAVSVAKITDFVHSDLPQSP